MSPALVGRVREKNDLFINEARGKRENKYKYLFIFLAEPLQEFFLALRYQHLFSIVFAAAS